VTSTNSLLRESAGQGAPEGAVLAAGHQTAGRGRLGRKFHSPEGRGAYFSLLLRPRYKACDVALITPAAAVAAALAIEDVTGVRVGIKWVNDLFLNGKKVCGILTEAVLGRDSGFVESAIVGIGINVAQPETGFPEELGCIATALTDSNAAAGRLCNRLIAATLDHFWGFYQNLTAREFLGEYRGRSTLLGQDIYVLATDREKCARALAIDDDCRLFVRYENGETAALGSGEVSVRRVRGAEPGAL